MARHVAEGGKPFDEFGTHIVGLSEEMNKLRKFKSYMGRNAVMAESLAGYSDAVNDRIKLVKRTIESLQKPKFYAETFKSFAPAVMEDVPADVKENWIDQLTIKQFNEELSDVFPYIYNLVSEATKATELSAEDLLGEGPIDWAKGKINDFKQGRKDRSQQYDQDLHILRTILAQSGMDKFDINNIEQSCNNDPRVCLIKTVKRTGAELGDMDQEVSRIAKELGSGFTTSNAMGKESYESQLEDSFEDMMGQFAEAKEETKVCKDCGDTFNKPTTDCKHDSHDPKGSHWVDANNNGIGDLDEGSKAGKEQKIPVSEFILSMFDRDAGKFPKGETAILTAIEKDYGEQYINPGKAFIEAITAKFEELNAGNSNMLGEGGDEEIFLDFSKELTDVERTDDTEEFTAKLDGLGFRAGSEEEIDLEGIPVNVTINATGYVQEGEFEIVSVTGDDGTQYVLDETDTWDIYNLTELFSNALATEDTNMYASQNNTVMDPTIQQDEELGDIRRLSGI